MNNKVTRYYVIADNYSWLEYTESVDEFEQILKRFIIILKNSKKMNSYRIFTEDITKEEMEIIEKNKRHMRKRNIEMVF